MHMYAHKAAHLMLKYVLFMCAIDVRQSSDYSLGKGPEIARTLILSSEMRALERI